MKRKTYFIAVVVGVMCTAGVLWATAIIKEKPVGKQSVKPATRKALKPSPLPKTTMKGKLAGLPEQPRCEYPALPDLTIKEFRYSGPAGPFQPSQQYYVSVVVQNIGQCESGHFIVKLQVRVQAPSDGYDEIVDIGSKRVKSIPPRMTGESNGEETVTFRYTTGSYAWAQYNFIATVDDTKHIEEWDERNNEKTGRDQVVDTLRDDL